MVAGVEKQKLKNGYREKKINNVIKHELQTEMTS